MKFSVTTLGCKANQYDACAISQSLRQAGLEPISSPAGETSRPDLLIVNTCCVTAAAMRKSRQAIRRAVRSAPAAPILVAGCYADYDPSGIAAVLSHLNVQPGEALVAGHHADLAGCLERLVGLAGSSCSTPGGSTSSGQGKGAGGVGLDCTVLAGDSAAPDAPAYIKARRAAAVKSKVAGTSGLARITKFPGRQRAFLKVQDGCDAFCSYCVVPYTRPIPRWRSVEEVEAECRDLVAAGHKEIVLCGVFLGAYGHDTAKRDRWDSPSLLPQLTRRVAAIEGLWRLRLSSLECNDVTEELLSACVESRKVAPHFHVPLQSGSDCILRSMNRQYTVEQFHGCVEHIRASVDRPAITTDIIVGFPGESEEDFAATLAAVRKAAFSRIHAFPFSPMQGTAAWSRRREAAAPATVKVRMAKLTGLGRGLAEGYRRQFIGESLDVLVEESPVQRGLCVGMSDRYLPVRFEAPHLRPGQVAAVRIEGSEPSGLFGTLVKPPAGQ
jgi:threonylcarbamoyladenosine tRNA methylthiotransferase MtaB